MANGKTLQAIVEIAGEISPTLGKSISEATGKLGGMNVKALAVGAAVGGIAVATGKAVFEAGKYLVDLGSQFDEASDSIRIGTGATGDALDALMDDFDAVYSSVPTTMEDASKAIADYNTRLGLTGPALQSISTQAIQVADMMEQDLDSVIEESSQAFQAWNIDAENMGDAMDYVFKASQSTGVGFNKTAEEISKDKALKALREFLRPEFISRIDEIIVFRPLDEKNYADIAGLMLEEMRTPLAEKGIGLDYDRAALESMAAEAYGKRYGAREIRRVLREHVEDVIAAEIIDRAAVLKHITVTAENGTVKVLFE